MSRNSNIVSTQRPPIAIRASSAPGRLAARGRAALRRSASANGSAIRAPSVESQKSAGEGAGDDPVGVLVVLVVEAQQRLDQAEADDDAGGDDRREHHLGGAVVGRGQVARVERQQRDRDQLREDARRRVGGAGRRQAAQVSRHGREPTPGRGPSGACRQRGADREQDPGDRVLEEAGVGHVWTSRATKAARTAARAARRGVLRAGQLAPFSDSPPSPSGAADARGHRPQGHDDQGEVEEQPDEALLGGDGDRLGVGDGDGDVLVVAVVAVGVLEGARAVALERAFGEEVEAAGDEVGAAAGVDVEAVER